MLLDGTICLADPKGNSLERFSAKPRYVLLAYHDDIHAFVYPITTSKTKGAIKIEADGANGYLILKHGLIRIPLAAIEETHRRWFEFGRLRQRIKQDLQALEESFELGARPLTQRGLEGLRGIRYMTPSPEPVQKREPPKPKPMSDEELFLKYLDDFEKRG